MHMSFAIYSNDKLIFDERNVSAKFLRIKERNIVRSYFDFVYKKLADKKMGS